MLPVVPSHLLNMYAHTVFLCLAQDVAQTPVAESIDLASMPIESSYDGPHLEGKWSTVRPNLLLARVINSFLQHHNVSVI